MLELDLSHNQLNDWVEVRVLQRVPQVLALKLKVKVTVAPECVKFVPHL